tara:strand:+ start:315 stop:524 length:210 start_codon:yes stop_codon:yes gene_type:complete
MFVAKRNPLPMVFSIMARIHHDPRSRRTPRSAVILERSGKIVRQQRLVGRQQHKAWIKSLRLRRKNSRH